MAPSWEDCLPEESDPFLVTRARSADRAVRRAERERSRASRRARVERGRAEAEALRAHRRELRAVPKSGERRDCSGRDPWPLSLPQHRGSSAVLRTAYPFLAGNTLGSELTYVGQDRLSRASFGWDPWELYTQGVLSNPNWALLGEIGKGKSALGKSLAVRMVAFGRRVYVPGDPKGEWTAVAQAVGGRTIRLGRGLPARLNPLDAGPRPSGVTAARQWREETEARRRSLVATLVEVSLRRDLFPVERTALDLGLTACTHADATDGRQATPTLAELVPALLDPEPSLAAEVRMSPGELASQSRPLAHELRRLVAGDLAGLFDGPSNEAFDAEVPMLSVDTSAISGNDDLAALVLSCVQTWMESAIADPGGGQRLVAYDEAWRCMRHVPLLRRMQAAWKLSRSYGTANGLIIHRLSDLGSVGDVGSEAVSLARGLLADASTRICYQVRPDQVEETAKALGLTDVEAGLLRTLDKGIGLWRVGESSFVVAHALSPWESGLVNTDARMTEGPR